jgi:hypothetical protein
MSSTTTTTTTASTTSSVLFHKKHINSKNKKRPLEDDSFTSRTALKNEKEDETGITHQPKIKKLRIIKFKYPLKYYTSRSRIFRKSFYLSSNKIKVNNNCASSSTTTEPQVVSNSNQTKNSQSEPQNEIDAIFTKWTKKSTRQHEKDTPTPSKTKKQSNHSFKEERFWRDSRGQYVDASGIVSIVSTLQRIFSHSHPYSLFSFLPSFLSSLSHSMAFLYSTTTTTTGRRYTEDGLPIYTEEELNIGKGGGTPLCPFDCNCCF